MDVHSVAYTPLVVRNVADDDLSCFGKPLPLSIPVRLYSDGGQCRALDWLAGFKYRAPTSQRLTRCLIGCNGGWPQRVRGVFMEGSGIIGLVVDQGVNK